MTLAEVRKAAAKLTATERDELLAYLMQLRPATVAAIGAQDPGADAAWYRLLVDQLKNHELPQPTWAAFKRRSVSGGFATAVVEAETTLHRWLGGRGKRLQRQQLRSMLAPAIVARAIRRSCTLPLWSAVSFELREVGGIFEGMYPGYMASGLIEVLLSSKSGGRV